MIHNIELQPGKGGQLVRAAGASVQLMRQGRRHAPVRLPSGEVRIVHVDCRATIGQVGNADQSNVILGKAGRSRWLGAARHVRGVAMNPVDHPHGGGEGKTSRRPPPGDAVGQADQGRQDAQEARPPTK